MTELLTVTPALWDLIGTHAPERAIRDQAHQDGLRWLREAAATRAWRGEITAAEALRITPDPS